MTRMERLNNLLAQIEAAGRPDHEIDLSLCDLAFEGRSRWPWPRGQRATESIDACIELIEAILPGWAWKVGTCSVSDDAWLAPDFNDPIHGERLRREIGPFEAGSIWDNGIDVDRRPSGQPALALSEAIIRALILIEERTAVVAAGSRMEAIHD